MNWLFNNVLINKIFPLTYEKYLFQYDCLAFIMNKNGMPTWASHFYINEREFLILEQNLYG